MMRRILLISLIVAALFITACGTLSDSTEPTPKPDADMANPASEHCVDQGGKLEIRDETDGQVGYCIFPDGSECEEWAFFREECAPGGAYQPLDSAVCDELAESMSSALGIEVTTEQAAFDDYIEQLSGTGCEAKAEGTGNDFESYPAAAAALSEMLTSKGWTADQQYAADGPTGTGKAFRLDNGLCLLSVNWQPAEDADCPDDQPIAACELEPEQMLYTAVLNCAQ